MSDEKARAQDGRQTTVLDFMESLKRALRTRRLYYPGHDSYERMTRKIIGELTQLAADVDPLSLDVRAQEFLFEGQAVLKDANRRQSLPHRFFRDGVRRITFLPGLTENEAAAFLEIAEVDRESPEYFDEDIASLLWKRNLKHVQYVVVEEVGEDEGVYESGIGEEVQSLVGAFIATRPALTEQRSRVVLEDESVVEKARIRKSLFDLYEQAPDGIRIHLTRAEVDRLKEEVRRAEHEYLADRFIDVLYELGRRSDSLLTGSDMAGIFEQILDGLTLRGDFSRAAEVLRKLRLLSHDTELDGRADVEELLHRRGTADQLMMLKDRIESRRYASEADLAAYFDLLEPSSVDGIAFLMGHVGNVEARQALAEVVSRKVRGKPQELTKRLSRTPVESRRYLLGAIATIVDENCLRDLIRAHASEDAGVRAASLSCLGNLKNPTAVRLAIDSLQDRDAEVRTAAVRSLASMRHPASVKPLTELVESRSFLRLTEKEQDSIVAVLAQLGGEKLIPFFEGMMRKRKLFGVSQRVREIGAIGLSWIESQRASKVLKAATRDSSSAVADAAKRGLSAIAKRRTQQAMTEARS